ncbi:MAG: hypothetical protein M1834_007541 [Cirrosporium novae-zelandiae]|nr:MAG: hypothetical protein M1834_007541 [Cirrosporium novae-zelandiae]
MSNGNSKLCELVDNIETKDDFPTLITTAATEARSAVTSSSIFNTCVNAAYRQLYVLQKGNFDISKFSFVVVIPILNIGDITLKAEDGKTDDFIRIEDPIVLVSGQCKFALSGEGRLAIILLGFKEEESS